MRQADALRARLRRDGIEIPVVVGMRNWNPYLLDTIRDLTASRSQKILGFILAAHRCEASWERYQTAVDDARAKIGPDAPRIEYPEPWHTHPKFIEAVAQRVDEAFAKLDQSDAKRAELIFTAHSIPVPMDAASGYADSDSRIGDRRGLAARSRFVDACVPEPQRRASRSVAGARHLEGHSRARWPARGGDADWISLRPCRGAVRSRCRSGEDRAPSAE